MKNAQLNFRLAERDKRRLQTHAKRRGWSPSDVARWLLLTTQSEEATMTEMRVIVTHP